MNGHPVDRTKSIEELSGYCWLESDFGSHVVMTSHAMRRKPLDELSLEDIRMGTMQHIGPTYLIPVAIEAVENDPMAESFNFPAEITLQLLLPHEYWVWHPTLGDRLQRVYERVEEAADTQNDYWRTSILETIRKAHASFRGDLPSGEWLRPLEIEREREIWRRDGPI